MGPYFCADCANRRYPLFQYFSSFIMPNVMEVVGTRHSAVLMIMYYSLWYGCTLNHVTTLHMSCLFFFRKPVVLANSGLNFFHFKGFEALIKTYCLLEVIL